MLIEYWLPVLIGYMAYFLMGLFLSYMPHGGASGFGDRLISAAMILVRVPPNVLLVPLFMIVIAAHIIIRLIQWAST